MNEDSSILAGLNQLTMNWASPIEIETEEKSNRKVTRLLESSPESWTSSATDLQPDFDLYGQMGFAPGPEEERGRKLLGVEMEGEFDSYFKDRPSPLLTEEVIPSENGHTPADMAEDQEPVISRLIVKSPDSARIILFASNSFLTDTSLELGSAAMRSLYLAPTQLIVNSVDWSLEDRGLLTIRGRGHFSRPLEPMSKNEQMFWEYLNYGLALLGLLLIWGIRSISRKQTAMAYQHLLENKEGRA
jgi:ABC-2 type transport system permease protein